MPHPKNVANVQTCRGSHTHTVLVDPKDNDNVYVYVSGSARRASGGRTRRLRRAPSPAKDPNSALFRIEVIKVPLAHPEQAAIVSSPRIFNDLAAAADTRRHAGRQAIAAQGARRGAGPRASSRSIVFGSERALNPLDDEAAARQHRQGARRHRCADGRRQRRAARGHPGDHRQDGRQSIRRSGERTEARPDAVPRHHGVSGDRPRRRRVRGLRPAARHQRSGAPGAPRARSPIRTFATGTPRRSTTTAPRSSSPTSGAAAARPKCRAHRPDAVGRGRDLHDRQWTDDVPGLLQDAGRRRRRRRTASRTTAR